MCEYTCVHTYPERGTVIRRELALTYALTATYSLGLGIAGVTLTFLAIEHGLNVAEIGMLSAASAVSQMLARLPLGWALRYLTDRSVLVAALAALGLSMVFAIVIPGIAGLAIAQFAQGVSRAGFWTASQTHVIRSSQSAARGLARGNVITSVCSLAGPLVAGWLAGFDVVLARWVVLALGIAGLVVALCLQPFPVFDPPKNPEGGRVSQRPGIRFASLGSIAGGAWMVTLTTYVPVVLVGEGWDPILIGVVISGSNCLQLAGTFLSGRTPRLRFPLILAIGAGLTGLGIACLSLAGSVPSLTVVALLLSGLGMGAVMTIGPAIAAEAVHPEERGQAMAITGSWRAAALLGVPLIVTAATLVMPVGVVLAMLGVAVGGPALVLGGIRRFGIA